MKLFYTFALLLLAVTLRAQEADSTSYKKRVLESTEVQLLMSYYEQDGSHSAVGGGVGTEELNDMTPTLVISIPLSDEAEV